MLYQYIYIYIYLSLRAIAPLIKTNMICLGCGAMLRRFPAFAECSCSVRKDPSRCQAAGILSLWPDEAGGGSNALPGWWRASPSTHLYFPHQNQFVPDRYRAHHHPNPQGVSSLKHGHVVWTLTSQQWPTNAVSFLNQLRLSHKSIKIWWIRIMDGIGVELPCFELTWL